MSESPIESGKYVPNNAVTLTVWNEGDPAPEGYDVIQTSDGSKVAVIKDRGEVKRDSDGNAYAIPEGGALAEYADGTVNTLAGPDLDEFVRTYERQGSPAAATTTTDSTGAAADQAAANPTTTTQQGTTEAATPANPQTPASSADSNSGGNDAGTTQGA